MRLSAQIEALLFASDQPLSLPRLCEVLAEATREEIQAALADLEASCEGGAGALRVLRVAGGYQLATKPDLADTVRRLFTGKRRVRLTKAALESLAIIAYKQPTTRPEIDAIRGVASGGVLETLLERNLIRIAGRSEGVGRPLLYGTTPEFLQYLGLDRLADLPSLEELEQMLSEREAAARLADEEELRSLEEAARAGSPPGEEAETETAAARLEEHGLPADLVPLEDLDEELRLHGERVRELSARLAADRNEHEGEPAIAAAEAAEPEGDAAGTGEGASREPAAASEEGRAETGPGTA
jgi:segregation and condensation protein B